jgi:hypothetical protein
MPADGSEWLRLLRLETGNPKQAVQMLNRRREKPV